MSTAQEWAEYKLTQLKPLEGLTFRLRRYQAPTPDWDHDHCYGCCAKFAEFDGSDIQHEGYFTTVPAQQSPEPKITGLMCIQEPTPGGLAFRWVCVECFEAFREVLGFTLEPE
jgi:hypothetical protein